VSLLLSVRAYRALGDAQFKMAKGKEGNLVECTPEVRRIELQRGDAGLILASDGLWDVLSDSAAVRVLDQARPPSSQPASPPPPAQGLSAHCEGSHSRPTLKWDLWARRVVPCQVDGQLVAAARCRNPGWAGQGPLAAKSS
jgi:hypothetical protein